MVCVLSLSVLRNETIVFEFVYSVLAVFQNFNKNDIRLIIRILLITPPPMYMASTITEFKYAFHNRGGSLQRDANKLRERCNFILGARER